LIAIRSASTAAYSASEPWDETEAILAQVVRDRAADGDYATAFVDCCTAVLNNGLGNYALALPAARRSAYKKQLGFPELLLVELVEAAARLDERAEANRALEHLVVRTAAAGTSWALGVEAYCRALVAEPDAAEALYRRAIAHLDACRIVPFRHRARSVFGEWLRRERRRTEAREHLQTAYEAFTAMGALGFAERARRELLATGGVVPRRTEDTRDILTSQEVQVAELAAADASNQEIAAQLFTSSSTVGYHLSRAFRKLGINSRRQLADALSSLRD
jgi:DNA-binding CsgD family transcriptional regulator